MIKILILTVETIIWLMIFELMTFISGISDITLLTIICAYTLAKVNYIEDEKEND